MAKRFQMPPYDRDDPESVQFALDETEIFLNSTTAALEARSPAGAVSALPSSPVDGQEIYYIADSTNGVIWHMRYRSTNTDWEYVGGPPLYDEVTTDQSTTSGTYAAVATAGPSIAIPLAGDYDVEIGAALESSGGALTAFMSYDIGGTTAVDADALRSVFTAAGQQDVASRLRRKTGLTAVTLTAKYKRTAANTAFFDGRWMRVTPVRFT